MFWGKGFDEKFQVAELHVWDGKLLGVRQMPIQWTVHRMCARPFMVLLRITVAGHRSLNDLKSIRTYDTGL